MCDGYVRPKRTEPLTACLCGGKIELYKSDLNHDPLLRLYQCKKCGVNIDPNDLKEKYPDLK
uniref:Uncharacterized protein n=1 Tax=viral metagenome TaxID=1070528 RepID=A0A6H1ZKR7_9ZZZZ